MSDFRAISDPDNKLLGSSTGTIHRSMGCDTCMWFMILSEGACYINIIDGRSPICQPGAGSRRTQLDATPFNALPLFQRIRTIMGLHGIVWEVGTQ